MREREKRAAGLFGLSNFDLSWLISFHIILFILPVEHYLLDQPNSPEREKTAGRNLRGPLEFGFDFGPQFL